MFPEKIEKYLLGNSFRCLHWHVTIDSCGVICALTVKCIVKWDSFCGLKDNNIHYDPHDNFWHFYCIHMRWRLSTLFLFSEKIVIINSYSGSPKKQTKQKNASKKPRSEMFLLCFSCGFCRKLKNTKKYKKKKKGHTVNLIYVIL